MQNWMTIDHSSRSPVGMLRRKITNVPNTNYNGNTWWKGLCCSKSMYYNMLNVHVHCLIPVQTSFAARLVGSSCGAPLLLIASFAHCQPDIHKPSSFSQQTHSIHRGYNSVTETDRLSHGSVIILNTSNNNKWSQKIRMMKDTLVTHYMNVKVTVNKILPTITTPYHSAIVLR